MSGGKCIIILSEKSSGSSACQSLLSQLAQIKHVVKTRHFENETLYWTKAASVLGLPQLEMVDSEVPIERGKAKADLITLLKDNLENYSPPHDDKELIINGWKRLCEKYAPIFLEKSPHHLLQWSAIELIIECIKEVDDIDFLLVGLVRNPMDTVYSQFKRWATRPEQSQYQWLVAYRNLLRLKNSMGEKLVIVRYEDMVSSPRYLRPVFDFCGVTVDDVDQNYLHQKSIFKWKDDKFFGFSLSDEVVAFAESYGYKKEELINRDALLWPICREFTRIFNKGKRTLIKIARQSVVLHRSK